MRGVAVEVLILDQEAEEALERSNGARRTPHRRRPRCLVGKEGPQIGRAYQAEISRSALFKKRRQALTSRFVGRAGQLREAALDPAEGEEIALVGRAGQFREAALDLAEGGRPVVSQEVSGL